MMQAEAIVDKAYRVILGRGADPSGLRTYGTDIREGRLETGGLYRLLMDSDEFRSRVGNHPEDRTVINSLVKLETDFIVQAGPFAGMHLLDLSNRGDGDVSPKLLGTYEQETHAAIIEFSKSRYDAILDIGCAEGYFAIGLARMFPDTPVLAYDTDRTALEILQKTADVNGCGSQIIGGDFCDPVELGRILRDHPRSLVIVDCEGYEKVLFSDAATNALSGKSDLIIECHDLWDPTITPAIVAALGSNHDIEIVHATGRDPNVFEFLAHLPDWDRFRAVWERRGARQNWLICRARLAPGVHPESGSLRSEDQDVPST